MACRVLPFIALAASLLTLAGCSNYERPRRPAWREQAENACIAQRLVQVSAYVQPSHPIDGPGICGLTHPFKVTALQGGAVQFNATYTLDCPMIAALDRWLADTVQPAAQARFGMPVTEIDSMGTYSCRGINNQAGAQLSEHSFGNAIDIGGFRLADGRQISIVRDWPHGDEQTQAFLREVHGGACNTFTTVLGPGANVFHYNHFHVDLAMHGNSSRGPRRICKPAPNMSTTPLPPPDGLPDAPGIDDDLDMVQVGPAGTTALALHMGPGSAPAAALPPPVELSSRPPASARAYVPPQQQPARGTLREDGAFVPEGKPGDWDLTSSIPTRN